MKALQRALGASAFALLAVVSARADTIYMKNGSVIRGDVVGYDGGQFTVMLGGGSQSRATLVGAEIDRIEFDETGMGAPSRAGASTPSGGGGFERPADPAPYEDPLPDDGYATNGGGGPASDPAPVNSAPGREAEITVSSKTDWTPTQVRVQRGDRVRIDASGSIQLDRTGKASSPAGVNVPDRDKLIPTRATGALIAVIGDDNDDFIFVGQQADFVAERTGPLYLSVNEGELGDNSGAYVARIRLGNLPGGATTASAPRNNTPATSGPRSQPIPTTPRRDETATVRPSQPQPSPARTSAPPPERTTTPDRASSVPQQPAPVASNPTPAPSQRQPSQPQPSAPRSTSPANASVRETDVLVPAKNDWTSTQIRVQRGTVIRISASGTVQLDGTGRRSVGPAGVESVDRAKLIGARPTGALIAVIGDDNDDFIFVGPQTEFTAQRDGLLFLSINEGELGDNSGAFNVRVTVEQPRTTASN